MCFDLSPAEEAAYAEVTRYIQMEYSRAMAGEKKNLPLGFLMVTYQRMLTSSSAAILGSFRRRIKKLTGLLTDLDHAAKPLAMTRLSEIEEGPELSASVEEAEAAVLKTSEIRLEIDRLKQLVTLLEPLKETKLESFIKAVREQILPDQSKDKLLVFTQFIETQQALANRLTEAGYDVAIFNGKMNADAKAEAVHRFKQSAQVLVSTEAGGEGRNLQFCHLMVNYDLPWNPMRVEQRIGRIDRIGQEHPVQIWNLATTGTIETRILEVLATRIRLFEESVGSLDPILGDVESRIEKLAMSGDVRGFDKLSNEIENRVASARETERVLADFVLDRASFRQDVTNRLLGKRPLARRSDLAQFVRSMLTMYGGEVRDVDGGATEIVLSKLALNKLGKLSSRYVGVFDFVSSLDAEDHDFFAFGHPLIDRLVDLPIRESHSAGTRILTDGSLPKGQYVELVYELLGDCMGPVSALHRHIISVDGVVVSEKLDAMPSGQIAASAASVPDWAEGACRSSRAHFVQNEYAERRKALRQEHQELRRKETERATRIFAYQQDRLQRSIAEQEAWLAERADSSSERDRRIMPARLAKLRKTRERLTELEAEYGSRIDAIEDKKLSLQVRLVGAAVVVSR